MRIVNANFSIFNTGAVTPLQLIEAAGRVCYKSETKSTPESALNFVRGLISRGHESVLEHVSVTVKITCDRGISHELVRHRIASYSQESTRFCNYGKGDHVTFIKPFYYDEIEIGEYNKVPDRIIDRNTQLWFLAMLDAEDTYLQMIHNGASPQEARAVLPNSLKTEIIMTKNLRGWRHFFKLRAAGYAGRPHPQMLEITLPMLAEFKGMIPVVFEDILP